MVVECLNSKFEIPDLLINKFIKDFDGLPGSGAYQSVLELRGHIAEVVDYVSEDPDALHEPEIMSDFLRALAMKKALETHGIFYDA
ncbi:hypothetical protein UFOVP1640_83 [uncultured Caudovirales phage]|jgi:hypothetical protein|uniref:Uncharacterized protein n=1 Tax=uncultured Caudovirales phage TaxID=2100421 RepID=A0A6J5S8T3_9CAUD|nr:hypothetical protein UFOVP1286_86 [uncultured Caudovirales phage]CAB4205529.1 hypothetical protein UFOVP1407_23 [uncultured Caudovirales phage]CAB4221682.1 hypothetical protein UFOVP1640_83 [uncultured Caudovirales phage]